MHITRLNGAETGSQGIQQRSAHPAPLFRGGSSKRRSVTRQSKNLYRHVSERPASILMVDSLSTVVPRFEHHRFNLLAGICHSGFPQKRRQVRCRRRPASAQRCRLGTQTVEYAVLTLCFTFGTKCHPCCATRRHPGSGTKCSLFSKRSRTPCATFGTAVGKAAGAWSRVGPWSIY